MDDQFVIRNDIVRKSVAYALQAPRALRRLGARASHYRSTPPVIVNSIPKSGTHLLMQIARSLPGTRYYGSFLAQHPSITMHRRPQRTINFHIARIIPGEVVGAHLHYTPETERRLESINALNLFIYRDPRDVVLSESEYLGAVNRWHAMHRRFMKLTPDDRIRLAIEGADPVRFPDIRQRLLPYEGWMTSKSALCISYEQLSSDDRKPILRAILDRYDQLADRPRSGDEVLLQLEQAIDPNRSHTFRSGGTEKWKTLLSPENLALFNQIGGDLPSRFGFESKSS